MSARASLTGAARAREPENALGANARERADGEWCTLEMNKAALLPRETWELCLGRGPLFCLLLLRAVRVQMMKTCVLLAAVGRKAAQPWKARPVIE